MSYHDSTRICSIMLKHKGFYSSINCMHVYTNSIYFSSLYSCRFGAMPSGNKTQHAIYISKEFHKYLKSQESKPGTKGQLRKLYYDSFKPTLTPGTKGVSFSTVMYQLKRMKILGTAKDRTTIIYYQSKKLVSVDQRYVQRQKSRASSTTDQEYVASTKEKDKEEEKESTWGSEQMKEEFLKNWYVGFIVFLL